MQREGKTANESSGNSFKTAGKPFQVRMPKVCKAVIKAKSGLFEDENVAHILDGLTPFFLPRNASVHHSICVSSQFGRLRH